MTRRLVLVVLESKRQKGCRLAIYNTIQLNCLKFFVQMFVGLRFIQRELID